MACFPSPFQAIGCVEYRLIRCDDGDFRVGFAFHRRDMRNRLRIKTHRQYTRVAFCP